MQLLITYSLTYHLVLYMEYCIYCVESRTAVLFLIRKADRPQLRRNAFVGEFRINREQH